MAFLAKNLTVESGFGLIKFVCQFFHSFFTERKKKVKYLKSAKIVYVCEVSRLQTPFNDLNIRIRIGWRSSYTIE